MKTLLLFAALSAVPLSAADLSNATVILPPEASARQEKAAQVLVEEIAKRSQVQLSIAHSQPSKGGAIILCRHDQLSAFEGLPEFDEPPGPEGFEIRSVGGSVYIVGADDRGALFGAGDLLRRMTLARGGIVRAPDSLAVSTAPAVPLRGHQLGYRPKTNSYDAFTVEMWEQYIRELAIFGTNAVELIPPRSDDADQSPHFPLPKLDMMVEMSRILDEYGLDVWIWYPALDEDYGDPAMVEFALKEWEEVFRRLPRIDHIFVPGGDPGHTKPEHLMALLEKQTESLRRYHPEAGMWVSPQGFSQEWVDEFIALLEQEPDWLAGVVYGPQVRGSIPQWRAWTPDKYPIRRYPDITHSRHSQYPVPAWDLAYQITEAREVINPRPQDQAAIFRKYKDESYGFLTYSEGINDDVNKFVWSGLGWDPDADAFRILEQYSRFFIGPAFEASFAQGLLALEENWRGPLLNNPGVESTLARFRSMERSASPQLKLNWRFQQALYRAYYDAFVRERLLYETALEQQAMARLRQAGRLGSLAAIEQAEAILNRALTQPAAEDLRARVYELAEALYQSSRSQLSVDRYQAISIGRGANLDTTDLPLNDRWRLQQQFAAIRRIQEEEQRQKAIRELVERTNPGPGGFYDDLGNLSLQPHLVSGPKYESDPGLLRSPYPSLGALGYGRANLATGYETNYPIAWWRVASAWYDSPIKLRYENLDRERPYRVRVVYAGSTTKPKIRLLADNSEVHDYLSRPIPFRPLEFDVPAQATRDGRLELTFEKEPGVGGNGRGLEIAEVWLLQGAAE